MPFFSIVLPTYNRASRLAIAIRSALDQSFTDFELIIVDDGSTDDTAKVVAQFEDSRINYYWKKNEERSIARNYGIEKATGNYINFLDSDDLFYPHHLAIAYAFIGEKKNPEVVHLGYEMKNEAGEVLYKRNDLDKNLEERILQENILHCNAIFIRKDIALQYPFIPDTRAIISEDWYVWLRLIARFPVHVDHTITSAIIEHEQRSLRQIDPDKLIASTIVIIKYLKQDVVFLQRYEAKVSQFFANMYTLVTLVLSLTGKRRSDTFKYLLKAIRENLTVIFRRRFLASVKYLLFSLIK